MHGLRCDPAFLGWTRLLDEWIVGLTYYNRSASTDPVCWEDSHRTLSTLADAATRVRSFAYREADIEPTRILDDATLRFELQGRAYRVAADQHWPDASDGVETSAPRWLKAAEERARSVAQGKENAVGVVFVTPRLAPSLSVDAPFAAADTFIAAGRAVRCRGCAFSFPDAQEIDRYRYGNDVYPGAMVWAESA